MAETDAPPRADNRNIPLLFRVFSLAVPLTIVAGVFLGITGYPVEEWPFVGGVFAVSLLLSGTLVIWLLRFVGNKLNDYGRSALADRGIATDAAVVDAAVPRIPWIVATVVVLLLLGTVWGLALTVVVLVLESMAMPPLGAGLPLVAAVLLFVSAGGLAVSLLLGFGIFYWFKRLERQQVLVYGIARFVFHAARATEVSTFFRWVGWFPVRSRSG